MDVTHREMRMATVTSLFLHCKLKAGVVFIIFRTNIKVTIYCGQASSGHIY